VSNCTISLNGLVEVAKEAGGPGYQEEEEDQAEVWYRDTVCEFATVFRA